MSARSDLPEDFEAVRAQLDRTPKGRVDVVARCPLGLPAVVRVPPILDGGEPFPTRYWLCCPLARRRVSRLEAGGAVRQADERMGREPAFREAVEQAGVRYARERDEHIPPDAPHRPVGGIGGARDGVKCLHAHVADAWAGHDNPVATMFEGEIGTLDCTRPCVVADADGRARLNPDWVEPAGPRPR
jgi:hypothetical protein